MTESKNKKKLFVVFEGLGGSGKTILAKILAIDLKGIYIRLMESLRLEQLRLIFLFLYQMKLRAALNQEKEGEDKVRYNKRIYFH